MCRRYKDLYIQDLYIQDLRTMQGEEEAKESNIKSRLNAFKEKFPKMTKAIKWMGEPVNVARTSQALGGINTALGKIKTKDSFLISYGQSKHLLRTCFLSACYLLLQVSCRQNELDS